jgi:hypothetical protein
VRVLRAVFATTALIGALVPAASASAAVGFKARATLVGETSTDPTAVHFGPDGRLYVAQQDGLIKAYTITRDAPTSATAAGTYRVTATQTIDLVQKIPNHDDDGSVNASVVTRVVTGMFVAGTPTTPVVYVTSSDPRFGGGDSGTDANLDTNSGVISQLTWTGSTWTKLDLVRGLPRSENIHSLNGITLDTVTNTLYVNAGGNTNHGAPSNNFAHTPEYAYSAAILAVDLDAIGETTYDIPTLDDETRAGTEDLGDPFGGNDGRNQARLVVDGPVQVFASGFRNSYETLLHSNGHLYATDNGGNQGSGDMPAGEGTAGTCTNAVRDAGATDRDGLYLITGPGYYQGHPNPTRANRANTFNPSNPQSPVPLGMGNPIECDYQSPGSTTLTKENDALTTFNFSTNGLTEYTASNFGGEMRGDILVANFGDVVYRVELEAGGGLAARSTLFSFAEPATNTLDVYAVGDTGPFPGTVWVANHGTDDISVFEPNDYSGGAAPACAATDSTALDEDGDGYTNADELDNATDPCSASAIPRDADGDRRSDLNDPDDDNDGLADVSDRFALDPSDGTATALPVSYTWDYGETYTGLLGSGFTGLMSNGVTDYSTLYSPESMTVGAASGFVTIDETTPGDALGATNTQANGFQFGVPVEPSLPPITARTRVMTPFAGVTPAPAQSMGMFVGTGTQDDYVKVVAAATPDGTVIEVVAEIAGVATTVVDDPVPMPGPDSVELTLEVDASNATVQARYRVTSAGVQGPLVDLGPSVAIPPGWVYGTRALAVGLISTSRNASPLSATWDLIEVTSGTPTIPPPVFVDGFEGGSMASWTGVNRMTVVSGDTPPGGAARAARALSTAGTTSFAWKQLESSHDDLHLEAAVKIAQQGAHKLTLLRVLTPTGGGLVNVFVTGGRSLALRNVVAGSDITSTTPLPAGWHHLGLHVAVNGGSSTVRVTLDGIDVPTLTRTITLGTTPIGRVWLGEGTGQRTFDVLFDDVMVTTSTAPSRPDLTPPSAPASVTATPVAATRVDVSWSVSSDNVGVTGYEIERDAGSEFVPLATVGTVTSFADTSAQPSTTYGYRVRAVDAAGNRSAFGPVATATTSAGDAAAFADGFESGDLSAWTKHNRVIVQRTLVPADGGSYAARATATSAATAFAYRQLSPASSASVTLRFNVVSHDASKLQLTRVTTATGTGILTVFLTGANKLGIRNAITGQDATSATTVSPGWHVLAYRVIVGGGGRSEVSLDGIPVASLTKSQNLGSAAVARLYIGDGVKHVFDVAFDDVRVTTP